MTYFVLTTCISLSATCSAFSVVNVFEVLLTYIRVISNSRFAILYVGIISVGPLGDISEICRRYVGDISEILGDILKIKYDYNNL